MADTSLVPFGRTEYPATQATAETPGLDSGVYISIAPQSLENLTTLFARWFANRGEVIIVDQGTSDKQECGYILMEWQDCEIDQLFLDILDSEDLIIDYTTYTREVE